MADQIKSGEIISANALQALKERISAVYNNRGLLTTTQKNYLTTAINSDISKNDINTAAIGNLINACLVINDIPNLRWYSPSDTSQGYLGAGDLIFSDGSSTNLLTWLSETRAAATGTSSSHNCRGACVGLCSGSCYGQGSSGNSGGDNNGVDPGSSGQCSGNCKGWCFGCSTGCTSVCINICKGTCTGFCSSSCVGDCYDTCSGCFNTCQGCCVGVVSTSPL